MTEKTTSQSERGAEAFEYRFISLLCEDVERLYELELDMMQEDIAQGWRCFYAEEVWLEKHLQPPLINDAGKVSNIENLRRILRHGKYAEQVEPDPNNYRNYLAIGVPDLFGSGINKARPKDLVANSLITKRFEDEHRHMRFEAGRDQQVWYAEVAASCSLTPPLVYVEHAAAAPVRNESVALALDAKYWRAVYPSPWPAMDAQHYNCLVKPECAVDLMTQLGQDFMYAAKRGNSKSLFFFREDERMVQWAIWIDKTDGSTTYRYPPQLALIRRSEKKVKADDILYVHHGLKDHSGWVGNPRDIEIQLRFHLPRIRKLITFLDPFVDAALAAVT